MSVVVSFIKPKGVGALGAPGIGSCRAKEVLSLTGTSTGASQEGEVIIVANNETTMILMAFGSVPDAQATAETTKTSAGIPIPAGQVGVTIAAPIGSKINVKTVA